MKIAVVGTGYVGLVTGACLSEVGNTVTCVDIDEKKIESLRKCEIPIYEHGLKEIVQKSTQGGRLEFTTDLTSAVQAARAVYIAVGTPESDDGKADLSAVHMVCRGIAQSINGYKAIFIKSTVPPGTARVVEETCRSLTQHDFDVISNPETLQEGRAVANFRNPHRVIVGARTDRAFQIAKQIYRPFTQQRGNIYCMSNESAEVTKYAANGLLLTRITFMHDIAGLCDTIPGANIDEVRIGVGTDERLGPAFLFTGNGAGGSCFPKDSAALEYLGEVLGFPMGVISAVRKQNRMHQTVMYDKPKRYYDTLAGRTFALWGLAFKNGTDDIRDSSAIFTMQKLLADGAAIRAYDPNCSAMARAQAAVNGNIVWATSQYDALNGADALIINTDWPVFKSPDFDEIKKRLKEPVIFDGKNLYIRNAMEEQGFTYFAKGRQNPVYGF